MAYDIIFVTGDEYFDHPLCGTAILKRILEKNGFSVGVIEKPQDHMEIKALGTPALFFAVSSGAIDSMVRNYTPLKKKRELDYVPDRAVTVYSNWIKRHFKNSKIVLGGTEASLRRFTHYDYWQNRLRKPIIFDSRADIIAFGNAEKQIVEIAERISKNHDLWGIPGTCVISKELPKDFIETPSFKDIENSKELFCDMHNLLSNQKNIAQKIDTRYLLQFKSPKYTTEDIDEYYELPFTRQAPDEMEGFKFSIVTHRGCIGECNFCSIALTQGNKIISRSKESILREIKKITKMPHFKGYIDNLAGPSAEMYGMDCNKSQKCEKSCIDCSGLKTNNKEYIKLLKEAAEIKGVKKVFIKTGIRHDLCTSELIKQIALNHTSGQIRISPEHVNKKVLQLMNKDKGDYKKFIKEFRKHNKKDKIVFYFMTAHPGSGIKEAKELAQELKKLKNTDDIQVFTPSPLTKSTCMYYTGMEPKTKEKIHIPYTYKEKKIQKRVLFQ